MLPEKKFRFECLRYWATQYLYIFTPRCRTTYQQQTLSVLSAYGTAICFQYSLSSANTKSWCICLVVLYQYGMEGCVQFLRSGSVKCWKKGEGTLLLEWQLRRYWDSARAISGQCALAAPRRNGDEMVRRESQLLKHRWCSMQVGWRSMWPRYFRRFLGDISWLGSKRPGTWAKACCNRLLQQEVVGAISARGVQNPVIIRTFDLENLAPESLFGVWLSWQN